MLANAQVSRGSVLVDAGKGSRPFHLLQRLTSSHRNGPPLVLRAFHDTQDAIILDFTIF